MLNFLLNAALEVGLHVFFASLVENLGNPNSVHGQNWFLILVMVVVALAGCEYFVVFSVAHHHERISLACDVRCNSLHVCELVDHWH